MSWTAEHKLNRITKFFKRAKEKKVPIFNEDVEALKYFYEFINEKSVSGSSVNPLFLKILAVFLFQNINYYGGIKGALKSANSSLRVPLSVHLENLTNLLNDIELNNFFREKGFDEKIVKTEKEEKERLELFKQHEKEIIEKIKNSWSVESVTESFYKTANGYISDLDNYV